MPKKTSVEVPPTKYHMKVTNRNRKWLEKKFGFDIPTDVEWIIAGDNFEDWLDAPLEDAIKMSDTGEKEYTGVELID